MDNSKIIKAARDVLKCTEEPFLIVVPEERNLEVFFKDHTDIVDSVTCRFDNEAADSMCVSFNDEPQPELPENVAVLSGTIAHNISLVFPYFDININGGGHCTITISDEVLTYLWRNAKAGDRIKIRVHFDNENMLSSLNDILSHTREESVTINLKE